MKPLNQKKPSYVISDNSISDEWTTRVYRIWQGLSNSRVQIRITRSEHDPHRAIKRLQVGQALGICLQRHRQIARQKLPSRESQR